ncbi:PAS domain-containing protein [Pedobacter nutrimenti]|uniref:PAS domain-containing protein n=1 Tax=Pedobacter nutrimenti TaxID=1241337 RepID=UPI00292D9EE3|nr:PAS domain-containing protein [Pedobacter nutrimenti]
MPSLDQIACFFNIQPNPGIILKYEAPKFIIVHVNPAFAKAMNVVPAELLGGDFFEKIPIGSGDSVISAKAVREALGYVLNFKGPHQFTIPKDDRVYKIDTYPLLDDHEEVEYIVQNSEEILVKGIEEIPTLARKYHSASADYSSVPGILIGQEFLERKVLALNSTAGVLIDEVLSNYVEGIERLFPDMHCSIMKVKNQHIYNWISSSLPEAYLTQIDGIEIGDKVGSCGTAAFLKQRIIVSDIRSDLRWEGYKNYALASNLLACWSHPILNSSDEVIATFAIYYSETREPNNDELMVIERASSILNIILESRQREEDLSDAAILMAQGQELAGFGTWCWDISSNTVTWSDSLFKIYGLEKTSFKATFEAYLDLLHPEDKDIVYDNIQTVLKERCSIAFEERIIRPNGEVRFLKSWGRLKCENGVPVKMIGACLDISERVNYIRVIEHHHHKARDIAWSQTHLLRAPLARILGLVKLLGNTDKDVVDERQIISYLENSANELDKVIKDIIDKSKD